MTRRCDDCRTPLSGRHGHGFTDGTKLTCGRKGSCAHQARRMRGEGRPRSWPHGWKE